MGKCQCKHPMIQCGGYGYRCSMCGALETPDVGYLMGHPPTTPSHVQGCICPPTSEQTCQAPLCPRRNPFPAVGVSSPIGHNGAHWDLSALNIINQIWAIPSDWEPARRRAHAQVLISEALKVAAGLKNHSNS